ncbi:O-methyltransferase [Flavobacteriaceae bacterium]|jgi:caffeoyl-CoA O-methyltransferase|nr:O-methyltransferase [Flavobacteriaceae bacterium]MDA8877386.1 O-methyltransferase [Flavobacteriaceae bacterium]MDA9037343.1 O-methyltransferase [Flavobacteriaceae bacterium]MDA9851166.1 O-methyltransferase [Flavobacteriaceae bacterium]MDC0871930.1 O-methyltransferase [Flavobacteriaceae bacterium]
MQDLNHNFQTIQEEWIAYALSHSDSVPEILVKLEKETHQKVLQPRMLSGPLQGRLLSLFSTLLQPKKILEIGTFTGYATLSLAEGLHEDGELHTIDWNEELVFLQQKYFLKSRYRKNIYAHLGNALEVVPKIEGPFDLVFIDADKINYDTYFEQVLPKTRSGGLIISDNVMWSGKVLHKAKTKDKSTLALQLYNEKLKKDPRVKTVLLPFRDGLTLSWVR